MRLEVTRKSDLAIRALIALDRSDSRLKAGELADELGASSGFMAQVMTPLVKRGWVRSHPGPSGGYDLLVELDTVSVLDALEAVEGAIDTETCVVSDRPCAEDGVCALHYAWTKARTTLAAELGQTSIVATAAAMATNQTLRFPEKTET